MKIIFISFFIVLLTMFISGCKTGYDRQNGQWVWITNDEYHGKRANPIFGIDNRSFKVLANENYGADKFSVYFKGRKIKGAQPQGFIILSSNDYGYAKDNNHVFLDTEVIMKADPKTFMVLSFPYSKDKNDVYNGTIPMGLDSEEAASFAVTNEDKLMSGNRTTMLLDYFIESNPEYAWIKAYDPEIKHVIFGSWGSGKTSIRKFKGLKAIE